VLPTKKMEWDEGVAKRSNLGNGPKQKSLKKDIKRILENKI